MPVLRPRGEVGMMDRLTVMGCLEGLTQNDWQQWYSDSEVQETAKAALALLKEQENWLGIHQTTDGITFISSGTAKQGEDRGIMLGKAYMHEWLQKELLHRGLLTDEIRKVFTDARSL